jgi:hypothetical protein
MQQEKCTTKTKHNTLFYAFSMARVSPAFFHAAPSTNYGGAVLPLVALACHEVRVSRPPSATGLVMVQAYLDRASRRGLAVFGGRHREGGEGKGEGKGEGEGEGRPLLFAGGHLRVGGLPLPAAWGDDHHCLVSRLAVA